MRGKARPRPSCARGRGSRPRSKAEADYPARAPPWPWRAASVARLRDPLSSPLQKQEPWRFTRLDDLWPCAPAASRGRRAPGAGDLEQRLPRTTTARRGWSTASSTALSKSLGFSSDRKAGSVHKGRAATPEGDGPLHASLPGS